MATDNKYIKYQNKSVRVVSKPEEGENISVYVRPGDLVEFKIPGINFEDLEYQLVGGDIVIDIPNYGTFTFVSMALMGYNDTPPRFLSNSGKQFSLGDILSEVEEINSLPIDSLVSNAEINIPDNTARENEEGDATQNNPQATPQVIIQEIEVAPDENPDVAELDAEFEIAPIEAPEIIENTFKSNEDEVSTNSSSKTEESVTEGIKPTLSFDIDIQHTELSDTTLGSVLTVEGGGGISYDNIYPKSNTTIDRAAIVKQTNAELIDYSNITNVQANSLVINADNSDLFDVNKISRTITLNPNQPEGFAVEKITLGTSLPIDGFSVSNGTLSGGTWVIQRDNPDTEAIDGFTFDSSGNIQVTVSINRNQTNDNFELKVQAESIFNLDNVSEENKDTIITPVETTLDFEKSYGVNVKEVTDLNNPEEYLFNSFTNSSGLNITSGFVITTNINDNIILGSETIENTINGGIANDTVTTGIANDVIYGNTGNDIITSGLGDDIVDGGDGNDTLDFSSIDNTNNIGVDANLLTGVVTGDGTDSVTNIENITGTQDNDILTGDNGINILKGEKGADTLFGNDGNDTIDGGISSDTIEGGLGDDLLIGGTGLDTVSYEHAKSATSQGVNISLEDDVNNPGIGSATGIDGIDTLYDFENVIGSNYNDTIKGNSSANIINALAEDDFIVGYTGNDTIDGGDGIDTVDFSTANSGEEIDLSINRARGGNGTDRLYNIENVIGSNYNDEITGNDENNVLDGKENDDTIFGGKGNDTLFGGFDNDTLFGGEGDDKLDGGEGEDTANYSYVTTGGVEVTLKTPNVSQDTINAGNDLLIDIENLIGTSFNDTLSGDSNANSLVGGAGNDTISTGGISGIGEDYIDGGSGNDDLLTFTDSPNAISLDLAITTTQDSGFGELTVKNIENVEGSSYNDLIQGNSSANTLYGFEGNDTLKGREGNDFLDGGNGIDEVNYEDAATGVNLTLAETGFTATATIGSEQDTIKDIENIKGSIFADTLGGNSQNNSIDSGLGDDLLIASDGNDIFEGNGGNDTIDYSARSNSINIELKGNQEAKLKENGVDKDSLINIENVVGSSANDTIKGDSLDNTLKGQEGNDTLYGGAGNDYIDGGTNTTGVGATGDTLDYSSATTTGVTVDLSNTAQQSISATEGFDTLVNIENIIGSNFADTLSGNAEDNTLDGGLGNDTLKGGAGDDSFIGGAGIDTVDYSDVTQDLNVDLKSLAPTQVAPGQGTDTFDSIEGVIGGSGADNLVGTIGANNIVGGSGDDTLVGFGVTDGSGGEDTIDGGTGTDLISFGFTTESISLDLSNTSSQPTGTQGSMVVSNVENIYGGYGNDTLKGNDEDNTIKGSFGSDTLFGSVGNDTLNGGKNSEHHRFTITSTGVISFVVGGVTISATGANASKQISNIINEFNAQNASNILDLGTIGSDGTYIYLESELTVGNGTTGGAAPQNLTDENSFTFTDVVDYSFLVGQSVNVDLSSQTVIKSNGSTTTTDTIIDIEEVIGGSGDDILVGDDNDNILRGGDGNDTITGGLGSDTLFGDAGNDTFISSVGDGIDTIYGGADSDTVDYSAESDNIAVTLNGGNPVRVKINGTDNDYIQEVENITTGSGNDTLIGDDNNNTFISNDGDDTLQGGLGDDYLDGGNNTAVGDKADYSYISNNVGVNVDLSNNSATDLSGGTEVGNDTLINIENIDGSKNDDVIKGNSSNNTLKGDLGNDSLVGNDGDDYLDGGAGDDILKGGTGNDYLSGGEGIDTADFSDANGSVNIDLSATGAVPIGAGLGSDYFDSIEGAIGGSFNDTIKGTSGANSLLGNAGDDTLQGGGASSGYDYINGG
ncbi:MAG: hypothetical protein C0625_04505 [Arcobacter sp.]|nr:MAG: hypothetical protein C0625_04505 [Arcobacter sp.]